MPLVRTVSCDRRANYFISVTTLDAVKICSIQKFKLPGEPSEYKVCLESESFEAGTEIDCDEVLASLLEDYAGRNLRLAVMVLAITDDFPLAAVPTPSTPTSTPTVATSGSTSWNHVPDGHVDETPRRPVRANISLQSTPLPMHSIVSILENTLSHMSSCRIQRPSAGPAGPIINLLKLQHTSKGKVKDIIVNYLVHEKRDYTKESVKACVRSVFDYDAGKFKKVFAIMINDHMSSNGFDSFVLSVYNAVNYAKGDTNKTKRGTKRKRSDAYSGEVDCDDPEVPSDIKACDYGCVAYNPPLPPEENAETQERKRLSLLGEVNNIVAQDIFKKCYPTLRELLIKAKKVDNILQVLDSWPLLKTKEYLFQHSSILLGKNVLQTFLTVIGERSSDILGFMNNCWREESWQSRAKDVALVSTMLTYLSDSSEATIGNRNQTASATVVFPLLVGYFKEKENLLFRIFNVTTDDATILEAVKAATPVLIIKGNSIFDQQSTSRVLIFNRIFFEVDNVLEGILLTFLCYFIFGLKYPTELHSSLEFIQRFLLLINPECGSKREIKKKAGLVDHKVNSLSQKIMNFSSPWNI